MVHGIIKKYEMLKLLFFGIVYMAFSFLNFSYSQCSATINYTTISGTLQGCSPFSVSFNDPNNTSARTWDFGDGKPNSSATSPFHIFDAGKLGDTTYTVTLTKACNGGVSTQVTVTVFAIPKVDFSVDTTSVCAINDYAKFTNLSDLGNYTWNFGDNTSSTLNNPTKAYNAGGVYDVSLKVTNSNGCEDTKTENALMTVNSLPSPDFYLDNYSGCAPLNVAITNTTDTTVVHIKYWSWELSNGGILDSSATPDVINYLTPGNKPITLTVTSDLGCKSSTSNVVNVITSPSSDFTINPTTFCTSDSTLISYTGNAGVDATYTWNFNGGSGNPGNGKGPHWVNWSKGGVKTVSLIVTDSTCSTSSSNSTTVLISPIITLAASQDTICTGEEITLTTTPESLVDYQIFQNGALVQSGINNKLTTDIISDGDVFDVVAKDLKGCSSKRSNQVPIKVKIKPVVTLSSSDPDNIICLNDPLIFSGSPSNYNAYTFYNFSQALQSGLSSNLNTTQVKDKDSIFVEATNNNGCSKTSSNAFVMQVISPLPTPVVNCSNSTNASVNFKWDSIPGALGYEVSVNGGAFQSPSSGVLGNLHTVSGLNNGDTSKLVVRALGSVTCGNSSISVQKACVANFCNPITFDYTPFQTICEGESLNLEIANFSSSNYSLTWGNSSPSNDTTKIVSPIVDTDYSVVIIDSQYLATCLPQEITFRVTVNAKPNVTLSSSLTTTSCEGSPTYLIATPATYDKYTFYNGNEILQSNWINKVWNYDVKDGVPMKVVATNNGCTATSNLITNTVVKPLDQPVVNCGNSTTSSIEFKWDAISGATAYQVSVDGGAWKTASSGASGLSHVLNGLSPGTASYISVKAIGATICGNSQVSTQASCFTSPCTAITYNTQSNLSLCKGNSVNLSVSSISISNYLVSWNTVNFAKTLTYNVAPTKDTTVTVLVKNVNETNCPFVSKYIRINVLEQPNVSLTLDPGLSCLGDSVDLIASPSYYSTYKFYNGSSLLYSGYKSTFRTADLKNGSQLKVVARNGSCSDTSAFQTITIDPPLERPILNSGVITSSSIEFVWDTIPNAIGYIISINDAPYVTPSTGNLGLSHTVSGLVMNTLRYAKVIALSNNACGNSVESDTIHRFTTNHIDSSCTATTYYLTPHTSICEGDAITVGVSSINATNRVIKWNSDAPGQLTTYSFSPVVTDTVKVSISRPDEPFCPSVTKYVRVTVNPMPVVNLSTSIANDSICEKDEITFTALPNGYATYSFFDGISSKQVSNNNEYLISKVNANMNVKVIATDDIGCSGESSFLPITMVPKPVITLSSNAVNSGICVGSDLIVSVNPSGFSKYKFYDNGMLVQDSSIVTFTRNSISKTYAISANAIHPFGCIGDTLSPVSIQLFDLPVITLSTSDIDNSICDGETYSIHASPSKMQTYSFYDANGLIISSSDSIYTYPSLKSNKSIHVFAVDTNTCQSKSSDTITVQVNPIPVMTSSSNLSLCSGNIATINLTSSVPSSYTWQATSNTNVTGEKTALQTNSTLKDTLTNTTITSQAVLYSVVPTSLFSCVGPVQTVTVNVNPKPVISNYVDTICSQSSFGLTPVTGFPTPSTLVPSSTSYTWSVVSISPNGTLTGSSNQSSGKSIVSQNLTNITNANASIRYLITPTSGDIGSCVGNTFMLDVVVKPTPVIQNQIVDSICSELPFNVNPTNNVPSNATIVPLGTKYTWNTPTMNPNGSVLGATQELVPQNSISQTIQNTTLDFATVVYTIVPDADGCVGNSFEVPIVSKPLPSLTSTLSLSICSEDTLNIDLQSDIPATFSWNAIPNSNIVGLSLDLQNSIKIADNLVSLVNTQETVTYAVVPRSMYSCNGKNTFVTVNVNPTPTITNQVYSLCTGDTLLFSPVNGVNNYIIPQNTSYVWGDPVISPINTISGSSSQLTPASKLEQQLWTSEQSGEIIYFITPVSGEVGACTGKQFTITADVHPIPNPVISASSYGICKGEKVSISTELDEKYYPGITYSWNTGQSSKNISVNPSTTTQYSLVATSNGCSSEVDQLEVVVDTEVPKVNAGEDFVLCRLDTATLQATGGKTYVWDDIVGLENDTVANPRVYPYVTTIYRVTATNDFCSASDEIKITIDRCLKELPFEIPQIITPNLDNANDFWNLIDVDYFTNSSLVIFNRWGNVVYEASPYLNTFIGENTHGDKLPDGTYFYSLDLGNGHEPYKGYIVITR